MSQTGLAAFDSTVHTTNIWLHEIEEEMGWQGDRPRAYRALRAVLHALRDRLTVDAAAALAAQLPLLVRGVYYEGWHPAGKPLRERKKEAFLAHIATVFQQDWDVEPEKVAEAVFRLLRRHVSHGEIEGIKRALPEEIRELVG